MIRCILEHKNSQQVLKPFSMKKHLFLLVFFVCFCLSANISGAHKNNPFPEKNIPSFQEGNGNITIEAFLALTPKKIKEKTGRRLTWKQAFALKKAQKKIRKQLNKSSPSYSGKSQVVALLLALFLGLAGVHRFYLGYPAAGILQLLTLGGCGVWTLIDLVMIATGDLQPRYGTYDETLD